MGEVIMHEQNTRELYNELSQAVNTQSINHETLRECFNNEHRYLQSELFYGVVLPLVEEMAEQGTDQRNERAVRKAQELLD